MVGCMVVVGRLLIKDGIRMAGRDLVAARSDEEERQRRDEGPHTHLLFVAVLSDANQIAFAIVTVLWHEIGGLEKCFSRDILA